MTFVIATGNEKKLMEMRTLLESAGVAVQSEGDVGFTDEIEETGSSFYENAYLKASAVCKFSGLPSIADDSGLAVDALGGAPGLYSHRYGGGGLGDRELCALLVRNMEGIRQRGAKFVSAIVCVFPNGDVVSAEGECRGEILDSPRGEGGFGYDPIFLPLGGDKTLAELSQEEKNVLSHRGIAIRRFQTKLEEYLAGRAGAK